jgi:glycosyltransferase involved in cell wall biosynthesis
MIRETLPYHKPPRLYERHDLFVMVSSRESAGISPVEAMATGLPVIVGSDTGTKYFVEPGRNGFVFEDQNFDEFVTKVEHFVENPADLERMGRAARQKIAEEYNPDAFERRFGALVRQRFPALLEKQPG